MKRKLLLLSALASMGQAPLWAASARYDVCYLWHADVAKAFSRRTEVAHILGPQAAEHLRVISADGAYAVLYLRSSDAPAARNIAAKHSKLLHRAKLGKAWPIVSRPWTELPYGHKDGHKPAASARKAPPAPAAVETVRAKQAGQLEALVVEHVKELRRQGRLSPDERTAWSVYDFTTGETLAEINADIELQAASLIKPFLTLAYMRRVEEGRMVYDDQAREQMEKMIQRSDNASADWVMRRLGGPAEVEHLLKTHYGEILGGVQIKEYIPSDGRTYRNKASARDYSRFLLALWRDELPGAAEIKRLMGLPKRDRLHTGVALGEDTAVFSKTGSTSRLCGDMGVLLAKGPDGKQYAYSLIGIIEKGRAARHYFRWLKSRGNVIREISGLVYSNIGALHGFLPER